MSKIGTVVFTTQKQDKPEGVVVGGYSLVLMLAGAPVGEPTIVVDASAPVKFVVTAPGDYTVSVTRIAESGEAISPTIVSNTETVTPDQIDVPLTITLMMSEAPTVDVPAEVALAVA
jgi:hypothetical protein